MRAVQQRQSRKSGPGAQQAPPESAIATVSSSSCPTTVELRGISIHFPFKPYKCQEDYMGKVLDALNRSENALLESPTGTGKTLCLLCATLAWQREQARLLPQNSTQQTQQQQPSLDTSTATTEPQKQSKRVPAILYASRTHSQLSQVVRELRNTRYRPKHAVLGSREQMCVHPKVKTATATASDVNHGCQKLGKERKCRYRNKLEGFVPDSNESGGSTAHQAVMDMEDLVTLGKTQKICPFYYTRNLVSDAEIIFIPYNYLFDKDARESTLAQVPWDNAVIIFDEAHNLESFASESASFDLSTVQLAGCISEVTKAMGYIQTMPELADCISLENLAKLKALFLHLEEYMLRSIPTNQQVFSGEYMMEVFTKGMSLTHANHVIFVSQVAKVTDLLTDMRGSVASSSNKNSSSQLEFFVGCVKRVFGESTQGRCLAKAQAYRVYVTPPGTGGRTLSYWCFAPSLAMQELSDLKVRSILVTSGTLSPLPSYSLELGLPFPHTVENPHIIGDDQIHVRVMGKGVSGKLLTSTYQRREDGEYILELGNSLVSLARIVPGGMLIFFPSYGVMETCVERWGGPARKKFSNEGRADKFFQARRRKSSSSSNQFAFPHAPNYYGSMSGADSSTPWKRLLCQKAIITEPKSTADLPDAISEFHKFLDRPKSTGCILMGVCRGKISEGIDFAHNMCRAVVITGLPFAPYLDPKVKLKREYLDGVRAGQRVKASTVGGFGDGNNEKPVPTPVSLSGAEWYQQQALRAVNQAIGRVIRNKSDYGAVLLLDARFGELRNQQGLSKWVRSHVQKDEGFGVAVRNLVGFYKEAKLKENQRSDAPKSGVVLRYEDDKLLSTSEPRPAEGMTKIAVIQSTNRQSSGGESSLAEPSSTQDSNGYVPPDRIIARMDLKKMEAKRTGKPKSNTNIGDVKSAPHVSGLAALYEEKGGMSNGLKSGRGNSTHVSASSAWSNIGSEHDQSKKTVKTQRHRREDARTTSIATSRKSDAALFFERAKAKVSPEDLTSIRKYVVAMKTHGDRNDATSYLRSARDLVGILVRYDNIRSAGRKEGPGLLELFFPLLPKSYRRDVEKMACKMSLRETQFYRLCSEKLADGECKKLASRVVDLMLKGFTHSPEEGRKIEAVFLRVAQPILIDLMEMDAKEARDSSQSAGTTKSKYVKQFLQVVPARFQKSLHALANELESARKVQRIKQAEKAARGEENVDKRRFLNANLPQKADPTAGLKTGSSPEEIEEQKSMETALMLAQDLNRAKRERIAGMQQPEKRKADARVLNPYSTASKIALKGAPISNKAKNSSDQSSKRARVTARFAQKLNATNLVGAESKISPSRLDPVAQCLQQVEKDTFVKENIDDKIHSNAPRDLTCTVCEKPSTKPCIAECGHTACLSCWRQWLAKSSTCPICRAPAKYESIARMVFEKKAGVGAPTLSQMCSSNQNDELSSDEELELVRG